MSNEELGFNDAGHMWRSGYDMDPDAFADETDRLWGQVEPLYKNLQCHVKYKLNEKYGDDVVPLGPILELTALILEFLVRRDGELRDIRSTLGRTHLGVFPQVADQDHLVD